MTYDYRENMRADIMEYIADHYGKDVKEVSYDDLYDELWLADEVTGNASGSYTFNTYLAEDYLCHNMDLLGEALDEFGGEPTFDHGAEHYDVTIRCYLLGEVLYEVLETLAISY